VSRGDWIISRFARKYPKQSRRVEIVEIVAAFARRSRLNSISEIAILSCATDGSPIFNDAKIVALSTVHNRSRIPYARHLDVYLRSPRSPSRSGQVSGRVASAINEKQRDKEWKSRGKRCEISEKRFLEFPDNKNDRNLKKYYYKKYKILMSCVLENMTIKDIKRLFSLRIFSIFTDALLHEATKKCAFYL